MHGVIQPAKIIYFNDKSISKLNIKICLNVFDNYYLFVCGISLIKELILKVFERTPFRIPPAILRDKSPGSMRARFIYQKELHRNTAKILLILPFQFSLLPLVFHRHRVHWVYPVFAGCEGNTETYYRWGNDRNQYSFGVPWLST